jgi:hypothetical protein
MSTTHLTYRGFPVHPNPAKPAWLYCPGLNRHIRLQEPWRAEIQHSAGRTGGDELVIYGTAAAGGEELIQMVRIYPPAACGAAPFDDADTWLHDHDQQRLPHPHSGPRTALAAAASDPCPTSTPRRPAP